LIEEDVAEEDSPPVPTPTPPPPPGSDSPETSALNDLGLEGVEDFDAGWDEAPAGTPLENGLEDDLGDELELEAAAEAEVNLDILDELDSLEDSEEAEVSLEELDLEESSLDEAGPGLGRDTTDPLADLFGNTAPEDFGELDSLATEQDLLLEELGGGGTFESQPAVDLDDLELLDEDDPFASLELDEEDTTPPPPPPPRKP
ncbi:MAG: hypothetical protein ACO4AI_04490, partial [Prochlorothrix sp.]